MKTKTIKLYKFSELTPDAQQVAIEHEQNQEQEYFWTDENRQTLEKFGEILPIQIINWSYGGRGEGVYFNVIDNNVEEISGQRLATWLWNNHGSDIYTGKYYSKIRKGEGVKYISRRSKINLQAYDCPLTGYYMDNEILDPIYKFIDKPTPGTTFRDLIEDCFNSWVKACNADVEYRNSDEYIKEELENRDNEYTKDGKIFTF